MRQLLLFLIVVFTGLYFDIFNIFKFCILSSIFHECGHIIAHRIFVKKWPSVKVSVFGFAMENNVSQSRFFPIILFSGPFVNLILAIFSLFLLSKQIKLDYYILFLINVVIFILNMLPVYYLDGGQILYTLSPFYQRNYRKISIISVVFMAVMVMYFTGVKLPIIAFSLYFIINILNDI